MEPLQGGPCDVGSPPTPAGSPAFFGRKPEERTPGASPWTPFLWPLVPTRSFWRWKRSGRVVGLFRSPSAYPDLETFFHKMLFQHIFPGNASQIGLRISEETAPRTDPGQQSPKRASGNERAIKKGVQGAPPWASFSPFLRKKWGPPPGAGREPTLQVWTCAGPNPDHLPGAARCCVPSGGVPPKPPWGAAPRCPPGPGRGPDFL